MDCNLVAIISGENKFTTFLGKLQCCGMYTSSYFSNIPKKAFDPGSLSITLESYLFNYLKIDLTMMSNSWLPKPINLLSNDVDLFLIVLNF
ncbi:hypothetical protein H5410_056069 [Solanum commersonii]|uniref:Uncharacterized protein n=1 Tax=Solanum commersonii TaxID=4109 RepID=A0A9J5WL14_SOLCO|nr:hypothetical protein H5410_056069 [Solanum commersonii]